MKAGLLVIRHDNLKDYSPGKRFRFAIVNLDKEGGYPTNFVCMLPIHISPGGKPSNFAQIFGDKSLALAKRLLKEGLKRERDPEIKAVIERRIELLEPSKVKQIKCSGCGRLFQPRRVRRFRQNFCEECHRKRFQNQV